MNIITLLNQIKEGEIVLPAIQRNFVWTTDRVTTLLDSIMRGYPVGIALLWETYADIPYRKFVQEYQPEGKHNFHNNKKRGKLKVVLDGQQRLQSLFVALYGSYDDQQLYFNVLSGRTGDDYSQQRYEFRFADEKEVKGWNASSKADATLPEDKRPDGFRPEHYISVSTLFQLSVASRQKLRKELVADLDLEEELRVEANLARFDEVLTKNENLLKASVIDENLPAIDSPAKGSRSCEDRTLRQLLDSCQRQEHQQEQQAPGRLLQGCADKGTEACSDRPFETGLPPLLDFLDRTERGDTQSDHEGGRFVRR